MLKDIFCQVCSPGFPFYRLQSRLVSPFTIQRSLSDLHKVHIIVDVISKHFSIDGITDLLTEMLSSKKTGQEPVHF